MSDLIKKLSLIQSRLKVPKLQFNDFGNFKYRSCEDILEAVKPHLEEQGLFLTLTDEVVMIGNRFYVKALATITDGESEKTIVGYAREEEKGKAGMDGSQVTGASSSYARKYALNGLFLIDDTKDSDFLYTGKEDKCQTTSDQKKDGQISQTPEYTSLKSQIDSFQSADSLQTWMKANNGSNKNKAVELDLYTYACNRYKELDKNVKQK